MRNGTVHHSLDALMRRVLTELELLSHVPAGRVGRSSRDSERSGGPPGVVAPHVVFARRYEGCRSDESRKIVLEEATREVVAIKFAPRRVDCTTKEGRLEIGRDPRDVDTKVLVYGYSKRHIYRCEEEARIENGGKKRSPGRPPRVSAAQVG